MNQIFLETGLNFVFNCFAPVRDESEVDDSTAFNYALYIGTMTTHEPGRLGGMNDHQSQFSISTQVKNQYTCSIRQV